MYSTDFEHMLSAQGPPKFVSVAFDGAYKWGRGFAHWSSAWVISVAYTWDHTAAEPHFFPAVEKG